MGQHCWCEESLYTPCFLLAQPADHMHFRACWLTSSPSVVDCLLLKSLPSGTSLTRLFVHLILCVSRGVFWPLKQMSHTRKQSDNPFCSWDHLPVQSLMSIQRPSNSGATCRKGHYEVIFSRFFPQWKMLLYNSVRVFILPLFIIITCVRNEVVESKCLHFQSFKMCNQTRKVLKTQSIQETLKLAANWLCTDGLSHKCPCYRSAN